MISISQASRDYWRDVLGAGGFTHVPSWTADPVEGVAEQEANVPAEIENVLRTLAKKLDVSFTSVMLAAHAKVLAALSGEQHVTTGYVAETAPDPLPCRLSTEAGSWKSLLVDIHQSQTNLFAHAESFVDDLRSELGASDPLFETVFDATGHERELVQEAVLQLNVFERRDALTLRLQYSTERLDSESAARILGYHQAALAQIAADQDATHAQTSLLSAEEIHFQIEGLAGPRRELPDRRLHELFEERAASTPDAIAAVQGDRIWTYRELNVRANRLGHALLERGVERESVVAVVTERNLDWMACVLAIFKAGGVYLPIEPHFPSDRIASMLGRAQCSLVLTEPGSTASLDDALRAVPEVHKLLIEAIYEEEHSDANLGVSVEPQQVAYIYFTSGSTGEPKGAMCEHAGMINHLYAKVEDFGIGEGQVVAQIAPQCFDISLWQLVSSLLVGGRTLIVEQATILDVEKFIDTIVDARVAVLQVVPSYLEVVLSFLEQNPRDLPDLRCVSVTGEAVTKELVQRWFAAKPGIKLANAYGLTETSDDTNHEVMDAPPEGSRVPLGRAINNAYVYVVDENLSPVPLGAPGEIVFSGVCVGRGYINDPERTRLAFMDDPLRHGERLYRSGDYGFWRPDRRLEFLGRRDAQVKIRGFRIEIGEIENRLSRIAGVRRGAIVVSGRGESKQLVGFYSGSRRQDVDSMREELARTLPPYMVPSILHWQDDLPLTANGKIDKKALKVLAGELDGAAHVFQPPQTDSERKLAAAWAQVLGVSEEQIGRRDHFFDRGGTSLLAVKVVVALKRAVSLAEVTRHPVLADLARLLDGKTERQSGLLQSLTAPDGSSTGVLVCLPYAGGNAVNFQPMARELRGSGLAVYAVELPGHDLAAHSESFAPIDDVVQKVVDEIVALRVDRIFLWGHSSGVALTLEIARALQAKQHTVERIFLAAQLLGDAEQRRSMKAELIERSNSELVARLGSEDVYPELASLEGPRAEHLGAAYRHDCVLAHDYLAGGMERPPAAKIASPVTVVVAADDPATAEYSNHYADWQLFAEHVDLHEIDAGGHYFLRTRPAEAVRPVLAASKESSPAAQLIQRGE